MEKEEYDDVYFVGLRSARRRQRQVYEDRDKHLLKLHREWKIIHPRIRAVEWVPLEHPYQRGWERIFVMREDLKRDRKASFYQKILDKINTRNGVPVRTLNERRRFVAESAMFCANNICVMCLNQSLEQSIYR